MYRTKCAGLALEAGLLLLAGLLYGCADKGTSPTGDGGDGGQIVVAGWYFFLSPLPGTQWQLGESARISWTTTRPETETITITLCRDTVPVRTIATTSNSGSYQWYVSGVGVGTDYRVLIASSSEPDKYDYSARFTIKSSYTGTLTITSPSAGSTFVRGTSLPIRWTTTGEIGGSVRITLLDDTSTVRTISSSTNDAGSYTWAISSSQASGSKYRIRVCSYIDTTICATSSPFTIASEYSGTFSVVAPSKTTTWSAGTSYDITWTTQGTVGSLVRLDLYLDSTLAAAITSSTSNTGTYSWLVPSSTMTGNNYRIRISSYSDQGLYAFSDSFSISGIPADPYEPDQTGDSAVVIASPWASLERSLTSSDYDWVRFRADSGTLYLVSTTGSAVTRLEVYLHPSSSYIASAYGDISTATTLLAFPAADDTTYYVRIRPRSSSYSGGYTITVKPVNSDSIASFTAPTASATWSTGSPYTIIWSAPAEVFGSSVGLHLYENTAQVLQITSYASNSGSYTWSIPAYLYTSDAYRIVVTSYTNAAIAGRSAPFEISGIARDQYEPDDSSAQAGPIATDGSAQRRTLGRNDVDWLAYRVSSDSAYIVSCSSGVSLYVYVKADSSQTGQLASGTSPRYLYRPTASGTNWITIRTSSSSYYGDYTVSIRGYDPDVMVGFTNPTSSATWSAGESYTITWDPDTSVLSRTIRMQLVLDTTVILSISSSTLNDGSQSWSVPNGLATSDAYRIRLVNGTNTSLYAQSARFSISGVTTDQYEPDNTASQARTVVLTGVVEQRSLSSGDQDWVRFTAVRGNVYVIETLDSLNTTLALYSDSLGATLVLSENAGGSLSNARITWYCPTAGVHYCRVSASSWGNYRLSVREVAAQDYGITVSAPATGQSVSVGSAVAVSWTSGVDLGGSVDLFLYRGQNVVATIAANEINDGSYSWSVPLSTVLASDYRVKVGHRAVPDAFGYSGVFTIE